MLVKTNQEAFYFKCVKIKRNQRYGYHSGFAQNYEFLVAACWKPQNQEKFAAERLIAYSVRDSTGIESFFCLFTPSQNCPISIRPDLNICFTGMKRIFIRLHYFDIFKHIIILQSNY